MKKHRISGYLLLLLLAAAYSHATAADVVMPYATAANELASDERGAASYGRPASGSERLEEVYLDIDTMHTYEYMSTSYAQGYVPLVSDDSAHLVVPFVASGRLRGDRLTVELVMGENAPFVYANYRKTVERKTYLFERKTDAYVFCCEIALERTRKNGKYPVLVRARGYSEDGAPVEMACRLYITVTDGINSDKNLDGSSGGTAEPDVLIPSDPYGSPGGDPPSGGASDGETKPSDDPTGNGSGANGQEQGDGANDSNQESGGDGNGSSQGPGGDGNGSGQKPGGDGNGGDQEPSDSPWLEETEPLTEPESEDDPPAEGEGMEGLGSDGFSGGGSYGGGSYSGGSSGTEKEKIYRQPRILMVGNSLTGEALAAGQRQSLTASFQNMSGDNAAWNLKVTVKAGREDISLSPSSFYFSKVQAQEMISLSAALSVADDAAEGNSVLTFTFEYEDEKGTAYSGTEELPLEVRQEARAAVEGFVFPEQVYAQETYESTLQICNTGRAVIRNAQVKLTAPGLSDVSELYIGDVEAGTSREGILRVYVDGRSASSDPGTTDTEDSATGNTATDGVLTLTYEDAHGRTYTQVQRFSTVILEPQMVELVVKEEEVPTNQWWAASVLLLAILFLLTLLLMARRLKKSRDALADLLAERDGERAH